MSHRRNRCGLQFEGFKLTYLGTLNWKRRQKERKVWIDYNILQVQYLEVCELFWELEVSIT